MLFEIEVNFNLSCLSCLSCLYYVLAICAMYELALSKEFNEVDFFICHVFTINFNVLSSFTII